MRNIMSRTGAKEGNPLGGRYWSTIAVLDPLTRAGIIGCMLAITGGCGVRVCKNHLGTPVKSPDGAYQAAIMQPACSPDIRNLHWVLLEKGSRKLRRESKRIAVFEGPVSALSWEGRVLVVHYGKSAPVTETTLQGGVDVVYRAD
jgi:hypothetical protein